MIGKRTRKQKKNAKEIERGKDEKNREHKNRGCILHLPFLHCL